MPFPKVAIGLPSGKQRKTPRVELIAVSRATDVEALCLVGNISKDVLLKIGRGNSYEKKQLFEERVYKLQNGSIQKYIDLITNSDTSNRNEHFMVRLSINWFISSSSLGPAIIQRFSLLKLISSGGWNPGICLSILFVK